MNPFTEKPSLLSIQARNMVLRVKPEIWDSDHDRRWKKTFRPRWLQLTESI